MTTTNEPFSYADDYVPPGTPTYLRGAPAWFVEWRSHEFEPLRKQMAWRKVLLDVAKVLGGSLGGAAVAKWPELGPLLAALLGG